MSDHGPKQPGPYDPATTRTMYPNPHARERQYIEEIWVLKSRLEQAFSDSKALTKDLDFVEKRKLYWQNEWEKLLHRTQMLERKFEKSLWFRLLRFLRLDRS